MTVKTPTKSTATAKAPSKAASAKAAKGAPLTEVELLKMSEKDYMNAAQLDFFRQKLLTLKDDILKNASDYGWCEETGEPIGLNRLIARPTANLSLEAQERRELRQKLFGD
jgi:DnaK suppressor protein